MKYDADWTAAQVHSHGRMHRTALAHKGRQVLDCGTAKIPEVGADGGVYDSATITCTLAGGGS